MISEVNSASVFGIRTSNQILNFSFLTYEDLSFPFLPDNLRAAAYYRRGFAGSAPVLRGELNSNQRMLLTDGNDWVWNENRLT
jgi:hypothetical protein